LRGRAAQAQRSVASREHQVFMNSKRSHFLLLIALITFASCTRRSPTKEYGYVFYESTGQNQYLLEDSRKLPFSFDELHSDKLALRSLQALSARILYPNSNGDRIILVGDYDVQTQLFRIQHWSIRVPFSELTLENRLQAPEEITEIKRVSLERTDFLKKMDFDPQAHEFDPKQYERR
jgi:hypothetical protein